MQRWGSRRSNISRQNRPLFIERLDSRLALTADAIDFLLTNELPDNDVQVDQACDASEFSSFASFGNVGRTTTIVNNTPGSNTSPTVASPIAVVGSNDFTKNRITLSVLGADDQGERQLTYSWSQVSGPANVTFSANNTNSAKKSNITFTAAGRYEIQATVRDAAGLQTTTRYTVNIIPVLTQLSFEYDGKALKSGSTVKTAEASLPFRLVGLDQFKKPMTLPAEIRWSVTQPANSNPTFSGSNQLSVAFDRAGSYQIRAVIGARAALLNVAVSQKLTSLVIEGSGTIETSKSVQLRAQALDQFNQPMQRTPKLTWAATAGIINSAGRFTAPAQPGQVTVTATSGTLSSRTVVAVQTPPNFGGFQDPQLAGLVQRSFADGSINRTDMIAILRQAGVDGSINTSELTDLRNLVKDASKYVIPDYVRSLADEVVNGNSANSTYRGSRLGNLAVGSSASQLTMLIDKWFFGTDRPTLTSGSYAYRAAGGNLFNGDPKYTDQIQGALGDCYFIAALGTIAMSEPDAIRNMFIDNNDGTYTIRFYAGSYGSYLGGDGGIVDGFRTGVGVAEYVTVDRWLPATSWGAFAYSSGGGPIASTANTLWIALAEKAYAQWSETGSSGRQVANSYAVIEGGWMSRVNAQVLGYNSSNYSLTGGNKQRLINALQTDQAITYGTKASGQSGSLVGSHAYGIIGYNANTDLFQLYNPWGSFQPAPMTYSQLQSAGTYFVVADASNFTTNVTTLSVRQVRSEAVEAMGGFMESLTVTAAGNHDAFEIMVHCQKDNVFSEQVNLEDMPLADHTQVATPSDSIPFVYSDAYHTAEAVESIEHELLANLDAIDNYFAEF